MAHREPSSMGIIGPRPESGVRFEVERPRDGGPPWRYDGEAVTPDARHALTATVQAGGDVAVVLAEGAPVELVERARLLLRAAWKHAAEGGQPPPRRIVRWRQGG